jgi:hypothetical protein
MFVVGRDQNRVIRRLPARKRGLLSGVSVRASTEAALA